MGGVGTGTTPSMNDMECHTSDCWMLLAVQEALFCISVTAAGARWFPYTNCTAFPQCLHSNPNQSLAVSVPPFRGPLWGRFSYSAIFLA